MRTLDIGVAAGYAILCVSLIAVLSPYPAEDAVITANYDIRAGSAVASYIQTVGLPFLSTAPSSVLCSSLESAGNATVVLGGVINGQSCGPSPGYPLGASSMVLSLPGRTVEIEAWIEGR